MDSEQITVWRLAFEWLDAWDLIHVLSTCKQLNTLYSEGDWKRRYFELYDELKEGLSSFKEQYFIYFRDRLILKLEYARKMSKGEKLGEVDLSKCSLLDLHDLLTDDVKAFYSGYVETQKNIMKTIPQGGPITNQMMSQAINSLRTELESTNPDPIRVRKHIKAAEKELPPEIQNMMRIFTDMNPNLREQLQEVGQCMIL